MKKLIYLILPFALFFGINQVKSASMNPYWFVLREQIPPKTLIWNYDMPSNTFNNLGRGYIIGSFYVERKNVQAIDITSIYLSAETYYNCEVIDTKSVVTGEYYQETYSLKCPVILGSEGWKRLNVAFDSEYNGQTYIGSTGMWSFVSEEYTNEQLNTIINILQNSSSTSEITSKLDEVNSSITESNKKIDEVKDNINNSDVSGANKDLNKFTENDAFKDTTGILAIIQAPINMLNSLTSTTCSPLSLPLPFLNVNLDIPCLSSIFAKHLSTELLTLLKLAINGFLVYKILCSFAMDIHSYKDPDSDRLEVIDL